MDKQKILITGAHGFLGKAVCSRLEQEEITQPIHCTLTFPEVNKAREARTATNAIHRNINHLT